ncbi:MAG TPA: hypothetical protein VM912_11725 [Terriglobales bacterium]|nr:hypothetical protein [Terriglobales bacterium]
MRKRVVISWSGGKDSAWTLHTLRHRPNEYAVVGLLTTINQQFNRIAVHGVRRELLEAQAASVGLPLWVVPLPSPCSNEHYERRLTNALRFMRGLGVEAIAFGDLYLQDIRRYREMQFGKCGVELLFPIWASPTRELAGQIVSSGIRARLTCVDPRAVPADWAGRDYDERLLAELPPAVDPCAENGEFHTFVYDGPIFRSPIPIVTGEVVQRDGFFFADLLPASTHAIKGASDQAILAG